MSPPQEFEDTHSEGSGDALMSEYDPNDVEEDSDASDTRKPRKSTAKRPGYERVTERVLHSQFYNHHQAVFPNDASTMHPVEIANALKITVGYLSTVGKNIVTLGRSGLTVHRVPGMESIAGEKAFEIEGLESGRTWHVSIARTDDDDEIKQSILPESDDEEDAQRFARDPGGLAGRSIHRETPGTPVQSFWGTMREARTRHIVESSGSDDEGTEAEEEEAEEQVVEEAEEESNEEPAEDEIVVASTTGENTPSRGSSDSEEPEEMDAQGEDEL